MRNMESLNVEFFNSASFLKPLPCDGIGYLKKTTLLMIDEVNNYKENVEDFGNNSISIIFFLTIFMFLCKTKNW